MDWLNMVERLGVPMGLLAAIAFAAWRGAAFCAPRVAEITEAHLKFVATVGEQTTRQTEHAERTTELLGAQHDLLKEQSRMLTEIHSGIASSSFRSRT